MNKVLFYIIFFGLFILLQFSLLRVAHYMESIDFDLEVFKRKIFHFFLLFCSSILIILIGMFLV